MKQLLVVNASPFADRAAGMQQIQSLLTETQPRNLCVTQRDCAGLPSLSAEYARAVTAAGPATAPVFALSEQLIGELERAQAVIISTPLHNFTLPAALKLWLDYVLRQGRTMQMTAQGKQSLLPPRPVLVLIRSGGTCQGESARQPDFLTPYLSQTLPLAGLYKPEFVWLPGGQPAGPDVKAARQALCAFLQPLF
ncbi:MAG: NAD(P)H-dependent oxidoreductase [Pseudomonadota bacterium]|nr:NAD(P)H-dependent oxidoreductase [Pseudomonadota bacterium]